MVDLQKQGKLFDWGAIQLPTFYDHPATWADSHSFAIPNNGKPQDPEKHKAVMEVIGWMNKHSTFWATAGHIPAYNPARETDEFKNMQPNATYASLLDSAVYDPRSKLAGVASPVYDAAGNYIMPAVNGDIAPDDAVTEMADDLNSQVE
jgi:multiple sugar transport system substrate-binding protein